ncbi:plant/F14N23-31 protein [Senna tora]|uniref:Plant/F14N23-31 protein n=1 Tax=Senna tora TaxID=362788 RepID=A0A834WZF3_9FABA|nr:plant/F14N23-31 protein [Senna tora]
MGGGRLSSSRKKQSRKKRVDGLRRRVSSRISKGSLDKKHVMPNVPACSSIVNPTIYGESVVFLLSSLHKGICRLSSSMKKKSRKRKTYGLKRRVSSQMSKGSWDKKTVTPSVLDCSSFANPAFHRSIDEAWFDSVVVVDSNWDDDYQSVVDDVVSLNGSEGGLIPNFPIKDANHEIHFCSVKISKTSVSIR